MRLQMRIVSWVTSLALLSASATPAFAQTHPGGQPVQPVPYPEYNAQQGPPPPQSATAPNGEYVSPLQQQTQTVYVPQSVAISGPRRITDWDDTQPVPPGYHVQTSVRKGMIVGGAVLFGVMYVISALTAAGGDQETPRWNNDALWIPAVGPFIQMTSSGQSPVGNVFLAIDGLAQAGGLFMFIFGIANPKTILVRNDLGQNLQLTPIRVGRDGYGMGLTAHF